MKVKQSPAPQLPLPHISVADLTNCRRNMRRFAAHRWLTAMLLVARMLMAATVVAEDSAQAKRLNKPVSDDGKKSKLARCTVREDANGWWLVSPSGKRFFSLGVCEFNQGTDKQSYDPAKPSYAGWRHYDSPEDWVATNLERLKSWGFTTLGGWSDFKTVGQAREHDLWMTPML